MTSDLKTTELYAVHRAMGAKLTDFGGYHMPLHYGSQIQEHHATRSGSGVFDVSHMGVIELTGSGSQAFLRYALSNDVARLQGPGAGQYSLILNARGGVEDDLILYRLHPDHFLLVVNCANKVKDLTLLTERAKGFQVHLAMRPDLGILALQGPNSADICSAMGRACWSEVARLKRFRMSEVEKEFVARTGYTGEDGFEFICPNSRIERLWSDLVALGAQPVGLAARDTLRLEAGYCLWGHEMDGDVSPFDANIGWAVHLQDAQRQFVGREACEAARAQPSRHLVGLVLEDRGVMRDGYRVIGEGGEGVITSGSFSPTLERSIALARVPLSMHAGQLATVEVRDKRLAARVCKPAFVANGRILVDL